MFFEMGQDGQTELLQHVRGICDDIRDKRKISLLIRQHTLKECLDEAKHSASFHEIDIAELSHYKELAHIGFWLAKLKPVSIASPLTTVFLINAFLEFQTERIAGGTVKVLRSENEMNSYLGASEFAINEHIALTLIWDACHTYWEIQLDDITNRAAQEKRRQRLTAFRDLFFRELLPALQTSLRLHSFTPRAFATTVECLLSHELSPETTTA